MKIKINCKLLNEQIQFLDMYSDMITDEYKNGLIDGVVNLLSEIDFAVEEGEDVYFEKCEEV